MKYVLAPLADFTDAPFRRLARECGADLAYTEMVSAAALAHGSSPTRHLMETMDGEGPVGCQIFGEGESDIAAAARAVPAERFVELNLNAGCPMPRIMQTGAGAKLVEDPAKVFRLLVAMRENCPLPVTLKTRLGPHRDEPRIMELLDAAEQAGARGITVHARSTGQKHGGPLDLDLLAEVVLRAKIPVTGNGSVVDAATAKAMAATGVAAIMVGRAALARPWVFADLKGMPRPGFLGDDPGVSACARHLGYILEFRHLLAERYPGDHVADEDGFASVKMHTHLFRYFSGRPGAAALRARLNSIRTLAEIRDVIASAASRAC